MVCLQARSLRQYEGQTKVLEPTLRFTKYTTGMVDAIVGCHFNLKNLRHGVLLSRHKACLCPWTTAAVRKTNIIELAQIKNGFKNLLLITICTDGSLDYNFQYNHNAEAHLLDLYCAC